MLFCCSSIGFRQHPYKEPRMCMTHGLPAGAQNVATLRWAGQMFRSPLKHLACAQALQDMVLETQR